MEEIFRINLALSVDDSKESFPESLGVANACELIKKLVEFYEGARKKSELVKRILRSSELSGSEKIFGLTQLEKIFIFALLKDKIFREKKEFLT